MKLKKYFANHEGKIQSFLKDADSGGEPPQAFYTHSKKEFWKLSKVFQIPEISVKSLDYGVAAKFLHGILSELGPFLSKHEFLPHRRPHSEEHSVHFVRPFSGRVLDFVHVVRLDFRYYPESGTMVSPGSTDFYPSYESDRVFYRSLLVPIGKGRDFRKIESVKLESSQEIETDGNRFSAVIFDEGSMVKKSQGYLKMLHADYFPIPIEVYQPLFFDYMTLCLNMPVPLEETLMAALDIFEPLFLFFARRGKIDIEGSSGAFPDLLSGAQENAEISPRFGSQLKKFFHSYRLVSDHEAASRGIKRLEIDLNL